MTGRRTRRERRDRPRTELPATALVLFGGKPIGHYVVDNLSASGALLTGERNCEPGSDLRLLLQLPRRRPLSFDARVIRNERRGNRWAIGIHFRHGSTAMEDLLQDVVLTQLRRKANAPPAVLVVHGTEDNLEDLAGQLEALGHRVVSASTALDAIRQLQETTIEAALIDVFFDHGGGMEFLEYMQNEHPKVRRLLMATDNTSQELSAVCEAGRAHGVLARPWEKDHLEKLLD